MKIINNKLVALSLVLSSISAFASANWTFESKIDEMTDEKNCFLNNNPSEINFSFQSDKLYIISLQPIVNPDEINKHQVTIRIDKNPAMDLDFRVITPHLLAIDPGPELNAIKKQFKGGYSFKVQVLNAFTYNLLNDEGSLVGFQKSYKKFANCEKS